MISVFMFRPVKRKSIIQKACFYAYTKETNQFKKSKSKHEHTHENVQPRIASNTMGQNMSLNFLPKRKKYESTCMTKKTRN